MLRFTYKNQILKLRENIKNQFHFTTVDEGLNVTGIDETSPAIKKFIITSYQDALKILRKEHTIQFEKVFYNLFTDDEKYFTIIRKSPKGGEMLFLYKFENEAIKDIFKMIVGNRKSSACFGTLENSFIWCLFPDLIDLLITARLLKENNEVLFERHTKKKKNGKVRVYYAPHEEIKSRLRLLNTIFQNIFDSKNIDFQVAYKKGKSIYDNAEIHKNKKYVYNIDLKDFYPSCKSELVKKHIAFLFNSVPGKDETIDAFLNIITIDDGLFIGSPVSGCLANAILSQAVSYMKHICDKADITFSVYADDMSFGSDEKLTKKRVLSIFNEAFVSYHLDSYFSLNEEKSVRYYGMNRKVTGISINQNNQLTTKRKYYRELRVMIAHLAEGDITNINLNKLKGKIAYALMVDDSGKFYRYMKKFMSTVKQYKLCSDERLDFLAEKFGA